MGTCEVPRTALEIGKLLTPSLLFRLLRPDSTICRLVYNPQGVEAVMLAPAEEVRGGWQVLDRRKKVDLEDTADVLVPPTHPLK